MMERIWISKEEAKKHFPDKHDDTLEEHFKKLQDLLPEICTAQNLVEAGLYKSVQAAMYNRKVKRSPPYFRVNKKVFYPRDGVLQWLRMNSSHESNKL